MATLLLIFGGLLIIIDTFSESESPDQEEVELFTMFVGMVLFIAGFMILLITS